MIVILLVEEVFPDVVPPVEPPEVVPPVVPPDDVPPVEAPVVGSLDVLPPPPPHPIKSIDAATKDKCLRVKLITISL